MAHTAPQSDPLSIALLTPGWPPEAMANGIISYAGTLIPALQELGVRCNVLTARPMGDRVEPFVHPVRTNDRSLRSRIMWRLDPAGWPHRSFCRELLRQVRRLHGEQGLGLLELEESYGWPRLLVGKVPVPMIVRLHGPWFLNGAANGVPRDEAFHLRDRWEKEGMLAANALTAPSRHVLEQTRAHFGLELPDAQVIANPVETVASANRWKLQACDRNRIVFVGRFDRHKGGDTMIDAFAHVRRQHPDARLDFIGPDRGYIDDDGRTWMFDEYLRERLSGADRSQVTYHGFMPLPKAAELRKRALVTVAPSRYETFGIAAAEAMMAGCPLVVSDGGALAELVQNGRNGSMARAGDAADVGDQVLSLLRNHGRAAELGEQAAADATQRYAPTVVARLMLDFYRRVLHHPPTAPRHRTSAPASNEPAKVWA